MAMLGSSTPAGDASPARPPHLAARTWRSSSGTAAGFEGGETLADVHCDPQLPVDAVDPSIDPPDLGEQFRLQRDRLGPESVDLDRQAGVDPSGFLAHQAGPLGGAAEILGARGEPPPKRCLQRPRYSASLPPPQPFIWAHGAGPSPRLR